MANDTSFPDSGPVAYTPDEDRSADRQAAEAALSGIPGVQGIGEGRNPIGDPAWLVYVRDKSVTAQLPTEVSGRPVVAEISGEIDILPA